MQPDNMTEHPEGGRFREVFRSTNKVITTGGNQRTALTHIYFALNQGERSRFHRVEADEIWNLYAGKGVRLYTWDGSNTKPLCIELSPETQNYCHVIPAGQWQAAEPMGESVLVGCSVGPGFEFQDFTLMQTGTEDGQLLLALAPELADFVCPP